MYMAGVQIKMRNHLGLNHQKSVLLYSKGMTIFGSSNWTGPSSNSQDEHNYFTTKPWFFQWFVDQFERKWNSTSENEPFVPLAPDQPSYLSPTNGAIGQQTTITLRWEGGRWAHKYDIYFGTSPNPPLLVADARTTQSGAVGGQPLLDNGSVDDGVTETYTPPVTLAPGTTYYWRVVGKTMANISASGPTWSFVTTGSEPAPPAPTGLTAFAFSATRIDLAWTDTPTETGYRLERSPNGSNSWVEIATPNANQTSYSDLSVSAQQTYYYRIRALNSGGFSPYSNVASATTPQTAPELLRDGSTNRALVLQSPLFTREPFPLTSLNLTSDQATRVMLFAVNVDRSTNPTLSVAAVSSQGVPYQLPIEHVGSVPGFEFITTLIVRLPQDPTLHGDLSVSLIVGGTRSNSVVFAIR
jgi:hypothetical protein